LLGSGISTPTDISKIARSRKQAATLPFLAVPKPDLRAVQAEVERWEPGSDVSTPYRSRYDR